MTYEGYIFPEIVLTGDENKDKKLFLLYVENIQKSVGNGVDSIITGGEEILKNSINFGKDYIESKEINEINEMLDSIYENSIKNYELVLNEQFTGLDDNDLKNKKLLIQVPSTHSIGFITKLIEYLNDKNSILSKINVEYFILDSESIQNFSDNPNRIEEIYGEYIKKVIEADKFIEIKDTTLPYASLIGDDGKVVVKDNESKFLNTTKELKTPRLKTYFPTLQQAIESGLNYKEFIDKWEKATHLDVKRIKDANEELIDFLKSINTVKIKGDNTDISINLENKYWRNSWGDTNQPGAEVFTSPLKDGVNGIIEFSENNIIKMFGKDEDRIISGLNLQFKNGKLINIFKEDPSKEDNNKIEKLRKIIFNGNEANLFTGEFAFGTTPHVEAGSILHPLLAEKAFGIHIALGNSYKYEGMYNGNKGGDYHWDIIGSMKDNKIIGINKEGEEIIIMEKGNFNKDLFPKLYKYKKEIIETAF